MRARLIALGIALALPALAAEPPQGGTAEQDGVRIAWRYLPGEAPGLGMLEVEASEAATGAPLRYDRGRLAAWLQRRRAALPEAELACSDKVKALASQGIGRRADIDLNAYRLLTLNTDGTLAVINPFVGLNNAKLESILDLGGRPTAWLPLPERLEAWVVLADPARLVAVDLHTRRITRAIDLPEAAGAALAWDAAGRRLGLGLPGLAGIGLLDPDAPDQALQVLPGPPPLGLFAEAEGPGLLALEADGGVRLLAAGGTDRRWAVPGRPRLVRWSPLGRRLVVATEAGLLAWIDPEAPTGAAPERLRALSHPAQAMALLDGGRRVLVLGAGQGSLVDLASGAIGPRLAAPKDADEILLTDRFAYALSAREGMARLWLLEDLRQGRDQPVDVTLGRPDPGAAPRIAGPAQAVAIPAGTGLVAANAADGMLYQYAEGMMAPVGSYSNYRRAAVGLALLDLSLREVAPGRYRSPVRHALGGAHELVLSGAAPRFALCAPVRLGPTPGAPPAEPRLRPELVAVTEAAPRQRTLRVRLRAREGTAPVEGIPDLVLLAFDRRSGWQARLPLREVVAGEYETRLLLPGPAPVELLVGSASRNLSFVEGRLGPLPPEGTP
ncbi:hypothetical protein [Paracraurococcus lichenis]|uniref:Uncharacterized protein n=1 Tax=Paracraurococcus lichenis TaxID=3064888 RepID=A0ABT9EBC8_9PROT|nr:hypothetical protein [Paracraurococcus sp. LOR1-02]MDO9713442.1 hypothetical protein [Paracraurococcus sp. LOR1-02]